MLFSTPADVSLVADGQGTSGKEPTFRSWPVMAVPLRTFQTFSLLQTSMFNSALAGKLERGPTLTF